MRVAAWLTLLLLAGCSGPAAPVGPEAPIADGGGTVTGKKGPPTYELEDAGSMLEGVDQSWTFTLQANATRIQIAISALPIEDNMVLNALEAKALHNGTVFQDGSVASFQGSFGAASGRVLIDIVEREPTPGNLTAYAGEWKLVLRGQSQVADYHMQVHVTY